MNVLIDVQLASNEDSIPETTFIESWVARAVSAANGPTSSEVSVRVVDAAEIQGLNKDYRGKDKATNVLSFPAGPIDGMPDDAPVLLGDIVVCADVVNDEASEQGKAVADHWAHLLVHGTLHLLGFDHAADTEAATMEALETRILEEHGIADPYGVADENC